MTKTEKKNFSKLYLLTAVAAMFFLVVSILLSSFQFVIYGDDEYRFYEKEYEKYKVTESLHMEMEDVMEVTEYMMDYLIGREAELSIETKVDGRQQDFFNEQDRLHMEDVKHLFLGGLKLRNVLLCLGLAILIVLYRKTADMKTLMLSAYSMAMAVFAAVIIFLGVAFAIDFTKCFTIFHEIFFTNDLWLFDPATDYMIRMLPEGFFMDMIVRILSVFAGGLVVIWGILGAIKKAGKHNQK